MLQNRVDPRGNIITTSARGHWMGNRGQLHDKGKTIKRPFKLKAWITCVLEFKDRHRQVMAPGLYTELFFLDEATAFAAGHRPCFECRREDYKRFKRYWLKGNPEYGFDEKTSIGQIDAILHRERTAPDKLKVTYKARASDLPDGTFIEHGGEPYLIKDQKMHHWSPSGYDKEIDKPGNEMMTVLTPKSVVNTFKAGYQPQDSTSF